MYNTYVYPSKFGHTFTTRMVEAGLNPKFVQDVLGHADISTTMNIYADCTKQMKQDAMQKLAEFYEKLQEEKPYIIH